MVVQIRLDGNEITEILESFVKERYPDFDWGKSETVVGIEGFDDGCHGLEDLRVEFTAQMDLKEESGN